ncbi:MAG: NifU family protein [Saprospiraceae bacterium]
MHDLTEPRTSLFQEVEQAIESIRPHLMVDGGDVEVVEITDDLIVKIKWKGNCEHCAMSSMTMKAGIEQSIKSRVPNIKGIEAINGFEMTKHTV